MRVRRDWTAALEKVRREGKCRVCDSAQCLQCAHTINRRFQDVKDGSKVVVKADAVVPLCQSCHEKYDARRLDLLPYVGLWEQLCAVEAAGGIESARKRLTGGAA